MGECWINWWTNILIICMWFYGPFMGWIFVINYAWVLGSTLHIYPNYSIGLEAHQENLHLYLIDICTFWGFLVVSRTSWRERIQRILAPIAFDFVFAAQIWGSMTSDQVPPSLGGNVDKFSSFNMLESLCTFCYMNDNKMAFCGWLILLMIIYYAFIVIFLQHWLLAKTQISKSHQR